MPRAKQLTAWVTHRPGTLGEIGNALGAKKVNIRAFAATDEGGRGAIRLVVDKTAVAKKALIAKGFETTEEEVLQVTLGDRPGAVGKLGEKLAAAGVNILYAYVGTGGGARKANVILAVSDMKAALKAAR
jgi:hypothetical protein